MNIVVKKVDEADFRVQIVGRTRKVLLSSRAYQRREIAESLARRIKKNFGIIQPFWYISEPSVNKNGRRYVSQKQ